MKMNTRVFVGGLTYRVKERDLEKFFRKYGRIREVSMKNGFAFVEFDDYRDAEDAIYELNGRDLMGEKISVERARGTPRGSDQWKDSRRGGGYRGGYGGPPSRSSNRDTRDKYGPPTRTKYRVYVENLSSRISWQDLKDYMRQAGEVTFADAHKQRRNEGIVEFASYKDLRNVIDKLDGTELNGRKIKLVEDRATASKRSRTVSTSRSRSHSRSRSRSNKRSKSRSRSEEKDSSKSPSAKDKNDSRDKSRSNSRASSKSRSRSRSPANEEDN
ncbi:unnamed protein product [Phyllotreta striolata]|uniref:RRM domain-containing protein n=1 Tax=Phyllotreta striolata TaxID=444603 RepID=A0A9P0GQ92_PHYSR|nr:unnamed protein product [Phyllotreta striolata]